MSRVVPCMLDRYLDIWCLVSGEGQRFSRRIGEGGSVGEGIKWSENGAYNVMN